MADTNDHLAAVFSQMADMMQILGESRFKVIAFQKAARVLDDLVEDVASFSKADLLGLDGIGKGTADRIVEYVETGKIEAFDELLSQIPTGVLQMLSISGLGPKTVQMFWQQAGVETMAGLKAKLQDGSLLELKGFGKKKAEQILKSIAFAESAGDRVRLGKALPLAEAIVDAMLDVPGVKQAQYAGSLRRGKETIGDVDILVAADEGDAAGIMQAFQSLEFVTQVIADGGTKTSVRTEQGVQVDLRVVDAGVFGAALMYFTGSKEHNVAMRARAQQMGMTLNEYGLYKVNDAGEKTEPVATETELDVFRGLNLAWVAPEMREDRGELKLAESDGLPELVTTQDITADLHSHTTASDGKWSIEQIAEAAIKRGLHTLAITDHSKSQAQANGLSDARLEKHIAAIKKAAEQYKGDLQLLAGSEVDILTDGTMDYPDELLAQLDVVVASPHAALSQEPAKATDRLFAAIEHPLTHIIGHPTGRLILRREGLKPDIAKLIAAAKQHNKALEINANHYRLDLRDTHARMAIQAGVKLSINTDAHGPADFGQLRYGVLTARRAGATCADIINCMSRQALADWLKR